MFDGTVNEFAIDYDKICYWDLLRDVRELGYDIEKDVSLLYVDGGGTLLPICDDQSMIVLSNQLSTHGVVDVYVETLEVIHGKELPGILVSASDSDVDRDEHNVDDGGELSDSNKDQEEKLVDVPLKDYNSNEDEETTEARDKIRRYV